MENQLPKRVEEVVKSIGASTKVILLGSRGRGEAHSFHQKIR